VFDFSECSREDPLHRPTSTRQAVPSVSKARNRSSVVLGKLGIRNIELVEREGEVLFGRAALVRGAEVQSGRPSAVSGVQP
jgi:hypothetical protein